MVNNVTALPHSARLQLCAVSLAKGQYALLEEGLFWQLEATYRSEDDNERHSNQPDVYTSRDASPLFVVVPGVYRLELSHEELGDKVVNNIRLLAGTLTDEVIYLGETDIDDSEENFHLNENEEFDADREYQRRVADRHAEEQYGEMAAEIRQPNILGEEAGFEAAQQVAQESGLQSHPLVGNSPQFDGIDAKLNPNVSENVHAAEAQKDPELRPGQQAKPAPSRENMPQFRPPGM